MRTWPWHPNRQVRKLWIIIVAPRKQHQGESDDDGESEAPMSSVDAVDMTRSPRSCCLEKIQAFETAEVEKASLPVDTVEKFILLSAEDHIVFQINKNLCLVCQMYFVLL